MSIYRISMPEDKGTKYESFRYPGGEVQVRVMPSEFEKLTNARTVEVTARITNGEIMELRLLRNALKGVSNNPRFILTLPYLPYARADRRFVDGDAFGIAAFGTVLNTMEFDEVRTWDVHSQVASKYINKLVNIDPRLYILQVIRDIGKDDLTILLPDAGASRYDLDDLELPIGQCAKMRDPKTGALSGFNAPLVKTGKVLIVDDICDGGGTFNGIADELVKQNRSIDLYLYITHGIFSNGLLALSQRFRRVYTTDSIRFQRVAITVPSLVKVVTL